MKVYHVTQMLKQSIDNKMMFPNYILEFRNTKVYLGWWVKIQMVIENHVC